MTASGHRRSPREATPVVATPESMRCAECQLLVEPAGAFHPWLHCWLALRGIGDPAGFLERNGFIPDPKVWGQAPGSSGG